jgi:hypothetical protein
MSMHQRTLTSNEKHNCHAALKNYHTLKDSRILERRFSFNLTERTVDPNKGMHTYVC